ncbi:hypothetical protein F5050DRAFT_1763140 [Lentinula boryana]|uniref:Uncharacterized protein n=1 Tax=Lentinula boryana TaxID=40481 RepID=A0ABQ8QBY5_9AGAR|nr:hypothetical protein F5050DRAFT_1763140 [Lentinula boryana]
MCDSNFVDSNVASGFAAAGLSSALSSLQFTMQNALIPDQRPFLPRHWKLMDLQRSMEFTDFQFGRFKSTIRDSAPNFRLNVYKLHSRQDPEKWDNFVLWVVENHQKLNDFVEHWPVEAYFNTWTRCKRCHRHTGREKAGSSIAKHLKIQPPVVRKYVGRKPPPLRCITNSNAQVESKSVVQPVFQDSEIQNPCYDEAVPRPTDEAAVRQPCLVCRDTPALASHSLNKLLQGELVRKGELVKLGFHSDVDLDTLVLLGPDEVAELLDQASLTNFEKASLRSALKNIQPRFHVKQGVTETDIREYIATVYTCQEHNSLRNLQAIPPKLLRLFNKLHIEHLIPAAVLLGVTSDTHFEKIITFDDATLQGMICGQSAQIALSPLQKVVLQWALSKRGCF